MKIKNKAFFDVLSKSIATKFKRIYPESGLSEKYAELEQVQSFSLPDSLPSLQRKTSPITCDGVYYLSEKEVYVSYVICVSFSATNTSLVLATATGVTLFAQTSGLVGLKGKDKKNRVLALQKMMTSLVHKFCSGEYVRQPVSLHLKRVGPSTTVVTKLVSRFFWISSVKTFDSYPYNGCRLKKKRRKKRAKAVFW